MNDFCKKLQTVIGKSGPGPILAHTDVFRSRAAIFPYIDRNNILACHIQALEYISSGRPLLFPTFNYDYLRSGVYRPTEAPSQVGALSEFARISWAEWRIGPPVFNFVGQGPRPVGLLEDGEIDPFGDQSMFANLHRANGNVLLYGTTLSSLTALHYVERLSGGPVYRYDKIFMGSINKEKDEQKVRLVYHCRPMGRILEYDFPRLIKEAEEASVLVRLRNLGSEVGFVRFGELCDFWLERLKNDPLYLLDAQSKEWIAPALERLGRRFEISDFE